MAITNASTLAEYASGISTQGATLTVDANNKRVGIGTTNPLAMLQVGTGVTVFGNAGIASFTSLKLSGETDSTSTTTGALTVTGGVGIGLSLTVGGDVSVGGTITYEDVTNVDSLGIVTARSGLRVVGGGVTCVGVATFFNNIDANGSLDVAGDVSIADKIVHTGDTNTALRFPSADTITAETGGSERLRITSAGLVGINQNTPTSPLHVVGSDNNTTLLVECTDADANVGPIIELYRNSASAADNDALGRIDFRGSDDGGSASTFARIAVTALDVTNNTEDARLDFTAVTNDTFDPTMSITGEKVGINITSPSYPLEVVGDGGGSFAASTNSTAGQLSVVGKNSGGSVSAISRIKSYPDGSSNQAHMAFETRNSSATMVEALRITSAQSVGIGTDNPTFKLDVNGTGRFRDDLTIDTGYKIKTSSSQGNLTIQPGPSYPGGSIKLAGGQSGATDRGTIIFYNSEDTNLTEKARFDSSGRLLIGHDTSRAIAGGQSLLQIEESSSELATFLRTDNGNGAAWLALAKSRSSAGAVCVAGDQVGGIAFVPHDGTDLNHHCAEIRSYVDTGIGSNDTPGYLTFNTNGGTTTTTERMRITAGGDIGINTTGVSYSDHIYLAIRGNSTSRGGVVHLGNSDHSVTSQLSIYDDKAWFHTGTAHPLVFGTGGASQQMTLSTAGHLGIGAVSPDTTLHIAGNADAVIRLENTSAMGQDAIVGAVEFEKQDASGAGAGICGGMRCRSDDSYGARTYLAFSTRENSTGAAATDTEQFRILSQGGVTFNGDTAQANALDDYEEGSYTPVVYYDATNNHTYSEQIGLYTKIGDFVYGTIVLTWDEQASTGQVGFSLPFTSSNVEGTRTAGYCIYQDGLSIPSGQGSTHLIVYGGKNSSAIYAYFCGGTNNSELGTSATQLTGAYTSSQNTFRIAFHYRTA